MNCQERCPGVGVSHQQVCSVTQSWRQKPRNPSQWPDPNYEKRQTWSPQTGTLSVTHVTSGHESIINTKRTIDKVHASDVPSGEAWDGQGKHCRAPQVLEKFKRSPTFIFKQVQSCILRKCLTFPTESSIPTVSTWGGGSGIPGTCMKTRHLSEEAVAGPPFLEAPVFFCACALKNQAIALVKLNPDGI